MKIALLLEREPFGSILEQTLKAYLLDSTGTKHEVFWYQHNPGLKTISQSGLQAWLCNPHLDAIFALDATPAVYSSIREKYGRSRIWWKTILYSLYVALASRRPAVQWLASHALGIKPALPDAPHLVIRGGINRIHILDYQRGIAHTLLKNGLPIDLMQSEIVVRRSLPIGISVPDLVSVSDDARYFTERLVAGLAIDQLNSTAEYERAVIRALDSLTELYQATWESYRTRDYLRTLLTDIEQALAANRLLTGKARNRLWDLTLALDDRAQSCIPEDEHALQLAITHGDLQEGNILWDGQKAWLLDWEFTARRFWLYDYLVFGLRTRQPVGLGKRLARWTHTGYLPELSSGSMDSICEAHGMEGDQRPLWGFVFLLEEIRCHLKIDANPLLRQPDQAFETLPKEIEIALEGCV